MNVKLIAQVGVCADREISIDVPEFVIGRDPACQLRLDHEFVSRRHCRVSSEGRRVMVEDLGSRLGTEINGRAIRSVEARDGDRLQVGVEQFVFSIQDDYGVAGRETEDGTAITSLNRQIECHPDERWAIESDWPASSRSAPESMPSTHDGMGRPHSPHEAGHEGPPSAEVPPVNENDEPATLEDYPISELFREAAEFMMSSPARASQIPPPPAQVPRRVQLRVMVGKAKGRLVEVQGPRFVIGRDPSCQLRPSSQSVSRIQAIIERREGKVFVRDPGSTNGTILNDRQLRGEEAEVTDGDRLEIGPLQFTLVIPPGSALRDPPSPIAEQPEAQDRGPQTGSVARSPVRSDRSFDLQLTCAIQPGAIVRLFTDTDLLSEPTPIRTTPRHSAFPGPGVHPHSSSRSPQDEIAGGASLKQLFHEILPTLGRGCSAPAATEPPSVTEPAPPTPRSSAASPARTALELPSEEAPERTSESDPLPEAPGNPAGPSVAGSERLEAPSDMDLLVEALLKETPNQPDTDSLPEIDLSSDDAASSRPEPRPSPQHSSELEIGCRCPECGTPERAPVSRLGQQLSCKVCASRSHIEASGEATNGHRPQKSGIRNRLQSPSGDKKPGPLHAPTVANRRVLDLVERLFDRWEELPRGRKIAVFVSVPLIFLIASWIAPFFDSPRARSLRVVKALTNNDEKHLLAMSIPTTSNKAIQWMHLVGPVMRRQIERTAPEPRSTFYRKVSWSRGPPSRLVSTHRPTLTYSPRRMIRGKPPPEPSRIEWNRRRQGG